ncbi:unnamed protein product, partial [Iphiclides podalirius]
MEIELKGEESRRGLRMHLDRSIHGRSSWEIERAGPKGRHPLSGCDKKPEAGDAAAEGTFFPPQDPSPPGPRRKKRQNHRRAYRSSLPGPWQIGRRDRGMRLSRGIVTSVGGVASHRRPGQLRPLGALHIHAIAQRTHTIDPPSNGHCVTVAV